MCRKPWIQLWVCVCNLLILKLLSRTGGGGCNFGAHGSLLFAHSEIVTEEVKTGSGKGEKLKNKDC